MKNIFLLLAGLFLIVGCSGNNDGVKKNVMSSRKTSNEIVVGIAQDLDDSLDPHKTVKAGTREVMFNIFEGLVKPVPSGDLIPAVAESFEVSSDGLTYKFILRDGVKFHNGKTVDMADVIYSIERCKTGVNGASEIAALKIISSMEADGNILTVKLSAPSTEFISYLTLAIIPYDYNEQDLVPIGTGPFKYVSRSAQDSVVFEKFDEYWDSANAAKLSRITFRIMENADSLLLGLQSGAIDICSHLTPTQVAGLGDAFEIEQGPMNIVQALYVNNAVKPFNDVRVRQALCYAVDKRALIDLAFNGYGSPIGSSMYPAFAKYFDESLTDYYVHDVEKAKSLLAEAGFPNGFNMTITAPTNYKPHMDTAEVLVEQLAEAGIKATIKPIEWSSWLSDVYRGRNFETTVVGMDAATMTARALLERFISDNGRNFINYKSANYDSLFAQILNTQSDDEQTELYKLLERDLTENAANVYIQDLADLVAVRKGIGGLRFYPIYVLDLSAVGYK